MVTQHLLQSLKGGLCHQARTILPIMQRGFLTSSINAQAKALSGLSNSDPEPRGHPLSLVLRREYLRGSLLRLSRMLPRSLPPNNNPLNWSVRSRMHSKSVFSRATSTWTSLGVAHPPKVAFLGSRTFFRRSSLTYRITLIANNASTFRQVLTSLEETQTASVCYDRSNAARSSLLVVPFGD